MDFEKYGPFMNVVAVASALAATFSLLLLKMFGGIQRWTWLASGAPSFIVTAAARAVAVAFMAITYVTITKENLLWFGSAACVTGIIAFVAIVKFDRQRERHVAAIPIVGLDGKSLVDAKNRQVVEHVVVGFESNLLEDAKVALAEARKTKPGLSTRQFMSGYGSQRLNAPESLWDSTLLADLRNGLTVTLMIALLFGVMTLYLAAFMIEVHNR